MTLLQKLNMILERLDIAKEDVREALAEKGSVVEGDFTVNDIGRLIRTIYQSDWELFFNFKTIDQFGTPRTLQSGQPAGGFYLFKPELKVDYTLYTFDMKKPLVLTGIPIIGDYGTWSGSLKQFNMEPSDFDIGKPMIFDEEVIAKELHYDDSLS